MRFGYETERQYFLRWALEQRRMLETMPPGEDRDALLMLIEEVEREAAGMIEPETQH